MKNRGGTNSRGFTLVEVLVALAIFSGLMLTLFSSFNAFMSSSEMIRDRQDNGQTLGPGLNVMISDLEQVFILQPPQFQNPEKNDAAEEQKQFQFLAEQDQAEGRTVSTISFASLSPVQFALPQGMSPGIARITYYVHAHGERLNLHRADQPAFLFDEEWEADPCKDPVLIRDIQGFDLVFFDIEGEEHEGWDSLDEENGFALPARVDIRITLGKEEDKKEIRATVSLSVNREVEK